MVWMIISGRDYLHHVHGDAGVGRSLRPRSPERERICDTYRKGKVETKAQPAATEPDMKRAAAVYTAVGLPVSDSWAAKLFQHLDCKALMGTVALVVGTNVMPSYQIEAQERMATRIHARRDTDLVWRGEASGVDPVLWQVIREFDPTFRAHSERPFQAIGRGSRELGLLAVPSVLDSLKTEPFRPVGGLVEQEWLLLGEPLRQVICSRDRTPLKPERDRFKATKDMTQARLVWSRLSYLPRSLIAPSGIWSSMIRLGLNDRHGSPTVRQGRDAV